MIPKINHYSLTAPGTVYDEEALTALELSARTARKVNECVDLVNDCETIVAENQEAVEQMRTVQIPAEVKREVKTEVQRHIDDGEFRDEINEYAGDLEKRLDNLLGAVDENTPTASSTDLEVVDARHGNTWNDDKHGVGRNYATLGEHIRYIDNSLSVLACNEILSMLDRIRWVQGYSLSTRGQLVELTNESAPLWLVGYIIARKGTRFEFSLASTENSCAVAIGPVELNVPVSGVVKGAPQDTQTTGTYTVKDDFEKVWFMCEYTYMPDSYIHMYIPSASTIGWTMGYNADGAFVEEDAKLYAVSDAIEVKPGHILRATLQAAPTVSAIVQVSGSNHDTIVQELAKGEDGNTRNEHFYINATDETVMVKLCSRVNALWDDATVEKTFFSDVVFEVKPYTEKYRVPTFTVGNGHISYEEAAVVNDGVYKYSDLIKLFPGETIRFPSAGSNGAWLLSEWNPDTRTMANGLVRGNSMFRWVEYTNNRGTVMWVRTTAKIVPSSNTDNVITEAEFLDVKIYWKPAYYADVVDHPLYGKSLALLTDSLFYGNSSGPDTTCWKTIAHKYNMSLSVHGGNGKTLCNGGNQDSGNLYECIRDMGPVDYIVVIGGANDFRLNEPVGSVTDTANSTFSGAVYSILNYLRGMQASKKGKILFFTNFNRFGTTNSTGASEEDYANAMKQVCAKYCVPCFDAYHELGVYFRHVPSAIWMDEGYVKALAYRGYNLEDDGNKHLSRDGFNYILPKCESLLTTL